MFEFAVFGALLILGSVEAKSQDVQLAPETLNKVVQSAIYCSSEVGVDPGLLKQIREKKYTDDENVKKFLLCAFKKMGVASKKGAIKVDKFLDIYPDKVDKEALKKVIVECQQEEGAPMDRVFNFFTCYQEKTPVHVTLSRN